MAKATNAFWNGLRGHSLPTGGTLLELFSPRRPAQYLDAGHDRRQALWADDALHRAKSLAQLSASLGRLHHLLEPEAEERKVQA
ncbi:MAG: hypothetical protein EON55_14365, partial [Alphaproteobacteria bacterium]